MPDRSVKPRIVKRKTLYCQKNRKPYIYLNWLPKMTPASVFLAYWLKASVQNWTVGSTHKRTSWTLNIKELSKVLCGSRGWTEIKKNRVPNFAAPVLAQRRRYSPRIPIVRVPNRGKKASKNPKYVFKKGWRGGLNSIKIIMWISQTAVKMIEKNPPTSFM